MAVFIMPYDVLTGATLNAYEVESFSDFESTLNMSPDDLDFALAADPLDIWMVAGPWMATLRDRLKARKGFIALGPIDTPHPELILCGDPGAPTGSPQQRGMLNALYDTFGGCLAGGAVQFHPHDGISGYLGDWYTLADATVTQATLQENSWHLSTVFIGNVDTGQTFCHG